MEEIAEEDVVIVGAGIAGLTTSLGLHRLGIRSSVLESSEELRITGFAFTTWTNAWKALDAIGVGDELRQHHDTLLSISVTSATTGQPSLEFPFGAKGEHEVRCLKRKLLLETLEKELPVGTIRFSSKVVSIEDGGFHKLVHLSDGAVIKAKVLIGCDGVNSVVTKWLGFKKAPSVGRTAIRGLANYNEAHGFEPKFFQFFGDGVRYGLLPCDDRTMYWFFTFSSSPQYKEMEEDPVRMKQFVLDRMGHAPDRVTAVIQTTPLDSITCSPLRFRNPFDLLSGSISKQNVCVAGDALHPMTPDLGQGGCAALEDGVVLARCLGEALGKKDDGEGGESKRIEKGLEKYAKQRKWRGFELISTAYVVGEIQQSGGKVMNFVRDRVLAGFLVWLLLKRATYDCGKLE